MTGASIPPGDVIRVGPVIVAVLEILQSITKGGSRDAGGAVRPPLALVVVGPGAVHRKCTKGDLPARTAGHSDLRSKGPTDC